MCGSLTAGEQAPDIVAGDAHLLQTIRLLEGRHKLLVPPPPGADAKVRHEVAFRPLGLTSTVNPSRPIRSLISLTSTHDADLS